MTIDLQNDDDCCFKPGTARIPASCLGAYIMRDVKVSEAIEKAGAGRQHACDGHGAIAVEGLSEAEYLPEICRA